MEMRLLKEVVAVRRADADLEGVAFPCQGEGNIRPRGPKGPNPAKETGQALDRLAGHLDDAVAGLDLRARSGAAAREIGDDQAFLRFHRVHTEPGPRRQIGAAIFEELVEDRLEEIDGNDHVALTIGLALPFLNEKRADPEELAVHADQCRTAPTGMGRRREDRLVQQVFPISREFPLRDDLSLDRMPAAAMPGEDD